jgi:hypothetical protein
MQGRSCSCLLALLLFLPPVLVYGQTGHDGSAPDDVVKSAPSYSPAPFAALPHPIQPPNELPTFPSPPFRLPPGTTGFPPIARAAGIIFSGTVTAIGHRPGIRNQPETAAITFHVEHAIRGAVPGEDLTILEWTGVWSSGQRYRVGERALLFLYSPSKLGLTSCVGGALGRFALDPIGHVLLSPQQRAIFRADPILGGKAALRFSDLAAAVRRAGERERAQ